jgi:sugar phosphate isomerase/epimerase
VIGPSESNDVALIASCWTTAGAVSPLDEDQRSPAPFAARVGIAADVGFAGFGITHADIAALNDTIGLNAARDILADSGIQFVELEMLMDWFTIGPSREASDRIRYDLLRAATVLPVRHIKVGSTYGSMHWPMDGIAQELRILSSQAADVGVRIALEPQAMANIRTPQDAMEVIERADHSAAGLLLDIWHIERIRLPLETIRAIPHELIVSTELSDADGHVQGTLLEDTVNGRLLCGEGSFRVASFVDAVRATGYQGPWGAEILSHAHRARPLEDAIRAAYASTRDAVHS